RLFEYLDAAEHAYQTNPDLTRLAFLVARSAADFETALEATLSGYQGVAADAMRDVMEVEYLLLDFAAHPEHVVQWLSADRQTRLHRFSPATVRQRLRGAGMSPFSDTGWEPTDYRAHSESLHVTPDVSIIGARGM